MKEKIYTIPVNEAFAVDCECPMCLLEKRFEDEKLEYILGPSLMEPDTRKETNKFGFCRRHFEMLYKKSDNRLGLALILDTHIRHHNSNMKKLCSGVYIPGGKSENRTALKGIKGLFSGLSSSPAGTGKAAEKLAEYISTLEQACYICTGLEYTMQRYVDVVLYLWEKETDFKEAFAARKGFCLRHFRELLEGADKYLRNQPAAEFKRELIQIQLDNMERISQEIFWFTKKFDYNNTNAPWGNSKDAVPRSIQKIAGWLDL
ncbi:MAG: DUF6062 family protein [Eubacteriales bacterium]|nr:DUF6062 family protein [Eubacteriales bacterium]